MTLDDTISRRADWLSAWVGDQLVMMSGDSSLYLNLEGSGGRIWELLATPQTVAQLCSRLAAEYEAAPEQIRSEVLAFLHLMEKHHAVDLHPATFE